MLWPKHISAAALFSLLTPPNEGYFGAYAMFLTETLPESLSVCGSAACAALGDRPSQRTGRGHHDFHRKALCDEILIHSWKLFGRPDLTQPFVEHVFSCLKDGGELFKGTHDQRQKAFYRDLDADVPKRRAFLLAAGKVGFGQFETFWLTGAQLLKAADFDWLLSISPVGGAPIADIDVETLCNMIQSTFDLNNAAQFEALYPVATQWEPLRRRYIGLLEGVSRFWRGAASERKPATDGATRAPKASAVRAACCSTCERLLGAVRVLDNLTLGGVSISN